MFVVGRVELFKVHQLGKLVEVKHRLVLAVLAKERRILAEIHVFEMICDKAAVTSLNALAKFIEDLICHFEEFYFRARRRKWRLLYHTALGGVDKVDKHIHLGTIRDLGADPLDGLCCVEL